MKLVIAIVHDEDGRKVIDELNGNGFSVTKLATTGGFLKAGNTTLLVGVEEDKVDQVVEIIKSKCKSRKQMITSSMPSSAPSGVYMPYPVEVSVGGATIFVVNVEKYEKT